MAKCTSCAEKKKAAEEAAMARKTFGRPRMSNNGVIEYPKKGYEPPPEIDGYQRDPGNAWRFLPIWPSCTERIQSMYLKQCGAMGILTVCKHSECEHKTKEVSYSICAACPLRKPRS